MRRLLRWYGASPLHLLAMLACFGLAGYAAVRLISYRPVTVAAWFLGAVIGHDLLLMPLYSLADRSVMVAFRHRAPEPPGVAWVNYVRVPAALSGMLLLVWFPLILQVKSKYHASTTLSAAPYLGHWLAVTGALFLLSAVAFALRLRRGARNDPPPGHLAAVAAAAPAGASPGGASADQAEPFRREPDVETVLEPASGPEPELGPQSQPEPKLTPEPEPEPKLDPEPEPKLDPEPGREVDNEPGAAQRVTIEGQTGQQREVPAPEPAEPGGPADSEG
jgi:hypothetical protein